jgi:hypothetical protein
MADDVDANDVEYCELAVVVVVQCRVEFEFLAPQELDYDL